MKAIVKIISFVKGRETFWEKEKKLFASIFSFFHSDFNPLPDEKILDWSKLKQIADIFQSALKFENKKQVPHR